MKKIVIMALAAALLFASTAYAKALLMEINQVRMYMDDEAGYWTGPQYPQKAGGLLNNSFPSPGGRTYSYGPMLYWGVGFGDYSTPATYVPGTPGTPGTIDKSVAFAHNGTTYTGGAFISGMKNYAMVATTYVINTIDAGDGLVKTYSLPGITSSNEDKTWYFPANEVTNPNNPRFPYNDKKYAYNPASLEPYSTNSDAYLNQLPGSDAFALRVVNPALITKLADYYMEYEADNRYHVYEIDGYNPAGDGYAPIKGAAVTDFAPNTVTTFRGIEINMNNGTATPIATGDSYIIRARGIISDMDVVMPIVDANLLLDGPQVDPSFPSFGKLDVVVVIRAYAWAASYIDTAVVYDVTFHNMSNRTYNNFGAGFLEYVITGYQFDNVTQYDSTNKLMLMYDYDGINDTGANQGGAFTAAGEQQWNTGDFGTSPYAMIGLQLFQGLTVEGSTPTSRFTLHQGYAAHFFTFQNGPSTIADVTNQQKTFMPIVADPMVTGFNSGWPNAYNVNYRGMRVRGDGSWDNWVWGEDLWDLMAAGYICYSYDTTAHSPQHNYYQYRNKTLVSGQTGYFAQNRVAAAHTSLGWMLTEPFVPGAKATISFAKFAVGKSTAGWAGGSPTTGDATYDKAQEIAASLRLLYENNYAPALVPVDPIITEKKGYHVKDAENTSLAFTWKNNSETSFLVAMDSAKYSVDNYIIKRYNGTQYETLLSFMSYTIFEGDWGDITWLLAQPPATQNTYIEFDENDPTIIWFKPAYVAFITNEVKEGLQFTLGMKFTDDTYATFDSYIYRERGLVFGYRYRYVLQSQDRSLNLSSASGKSNFILVPAARLDSVDAVALGKVKVVPNPLFVGTKWDNRTELSEVKFNHIPAVCTITIFNVAGEKLKVIEHTNGMAWESWNLLTKYNQEVAPGLYIYVIDTPSGERTKGTFSIIR